MAQNILLEAGTNEMELLVFRIDETFYGVNVAKVREIIQRVDTQTIPLSPPAIVGSFMLRDEVMTLVDLRVALEIAPPEEGNAELVIITELNDIRCGVLVDEVEVIHRLRWDQIDPPSEYLTHLGTPMTGVAKIKDRVVLILDFETILGELLGSAADVEKVAAESAATFDNKDLRILVVDDSITIRESIALLLRNTGFHEITLCNDGQDAWEKIENGSAGGKQPFDIILSDVEMPRMDGLHLCARIREIEHLKDVPVILFSSLIQEGNLNKGIQVGADAQVTKFKSDELLMEMERCLNRVTADSD